MKKAITLTIKAIQYELDEYLKFMDLEDFSSALEAVQQIERELEFLKETSEESTT